MSIKTVQISSLGELIDRVTPDKPDPVTGRRRDAGVYRGASDVEGKLLTSLDRLGGEAPHQKARLESHILRNFIRYSRPHLGREPANDWEHLVSAQHHGVPTRLLDWSYSPLVAAFFATRPGPDRDRVIWRLDWQPMHEKFDLPPLSLMPGDLGEIFEKGANFSPWDLFEQRDPHTFAALIEPPSVDTRLVTQAAVFTLCSDKSMPFDRFLEKHGLEATLTKFVVGATDVARVRDQLDLVGMDERRLFPDLDGVAASLRRYYG
ncbi:MAG TPA: FRG domain-containing protein [Gemmatimonadaceae bacterium]|nr:FRG domain-containing protein [Gemmatimonadaceae bacterium]